MSKSYKKNWKAIWHFTRAKHGQDIKCTIRPTIMAFQWLLDPWPLAVHTEAQLNLHAMQLNMAGHQSQKMQWKEARMQFLPPSKKITFGK